MNIPEEYKKPLSEVGRVTATLAGFILVLTQLGVAKKEDVTAAMVKQLEIAGEIRAEITELEIKLEQARSRTDVIIGIYQLREGISIFWDTMEPPEVSAGEIPSGPVFVEEGN